MTELRITRSSDIELYINDEKLFGVTDFSAKAKYESHPIRECLSGEPFAIVNGKIKRVPLAECAGKLKMVSAKDQTVKAAKQIGISFGD